VCSSGARSPASIVCLTRSLASLRLNRDGWLSKTRSLGAAPNFMGTSLGAGSPILGYPLCLQTADGQKESLGTRGSNRQLKGCATRPSQLLCNLEVA
jgi:hypothetical protein